MNFEHITWHVEDLISLYAERKLLLDPPYQRNAIWSVAAQQELIHTMLRGWPMPNFFILARQDGVNEVVDGQQRARTIIGFHAGRLTTKEGALFDKMAASAKLFMEYDLSITRITELRPDESIQKFYALVNSTGLRLSRPEVRKAEFYTTKLLHLVTTVAALPGFQQLGLFTRLSAQRMNDIEFVAELIGQLRHGTMDKKDKIDEMFDKDITEDEYNSLFAEFCRIVDKLTMFDKEVEFRRTRYRQKNDFYTLFGFIHGHPDLSDKVLTRCYWTLAKIGPYIRPSQDKCAELMDYAMNCVTQSNSKKARDARLRFMTELLVNRTKTPTGVQMHILQFFRTDSTALSIIEGLLIIDPAELKDPLYAELDLS